MGSTEGLRRKLPRSRVLERGVSRSLGPDKLMCRVESSLTKQVMASFTSLSVMILACWKVRFHLEKLFVLLSTPLGMGTPVKQQKGIGNPMCAR